MNIAVEEINNPNENINNKNKKYDLSMLNQPKICYTLIARIDIYSF